MALNFGKKMVVGVSITPDVGLEVAHVDILNQKVISYISKPLSYDASRGTIADLDIFKDTLSDCLRDLMIPEGSEIVLNIPSSIFQIRDWPASMDSEQVSNSIVEELAEHPLYKDASAEPVISYCKLNNSTIQMQKIAYTAANFATINEIAMQILDLKYRLVAIDTSINSTLNALIYSGKVNTSPDVSWVMLVVNQNNCKIITMQGGNYVDCYEEKVSIGEVLGDAENYATVANAVNPILKNLPSQLLYIVSKTSIISAEALAGKVIYNSPIVHMECNMYNSEPLLDVDPSIGNETAKMISPDVIGAAIRQNFEEKQLLFAPLNLFNSTLGDIYLSQTPPEYMGIEMSLENMLKYGAIFAAIILGICLAVFIYVKTLTKAQNEKINEINQKIEVINQFLEANKDVSGSKFSEADEIRIGLSNNKNIYSYYTIVGTEIPKKLWLTSLELGNHTTIKGQADNLESVYSFYRNIKDYNPSSAIKLQKLGLASTSNKLMNINGEGGFDTASILTSLTADFYEFTISDVVEVKKSDSDSDTEAGNKAEKAGGMTNAKKSKKSSVPTKELEIIDEEE